MRKGTSGIEDFEIVFVGSGAYLKECRQYVLDHNLGDVVKFDGHEFKVLN